METGCHDDAPECRCPCGCGCQNGEGGDDLPFYNKIGGTPIPLDQVGFCASCAQGRHEIPPGIAISDLMAAHQSCLDQLRGMHIPPGQDKNGNRV